MASAVVRSDEFSTLLDDGEWSPPAAVPAARLSPSHQPATPRLHGGKATTTKRPNKHAVTRFMCSPFAAVFRTCARASAVSTIDQQQPSRSNGAAGARRRRGARRRPSLEQLLRMEAPPPPPAAPLSSSAARPAERGKGRPSCALMKEEEEEEEEEPLSYIIVAPDEEEHGHAAAAVPAAAELELKLEPAGRGETNATKRLVVVVFASLRACSRRPLRINSGKVAAAHGPGKTELFYYRPIPMGRRCRVQHLEESPYK